MFINNLRRQDDIQLKLLNDSILILGYNFRHLDEIQLDILVDNLQFLDDIQLEMLVDSLPMLSEN